MEEFQTCKVYRYDRPLDLKIIQNKLELHLGHINSITGRKNIAIKKFTNENDALIFSVITEKPIKLPEEKFAMMPINHAVAISKIHKLMIIFRPQPSELFPKLFATLIQGSWKPRIFHEAYYDKTQIRKFIESLQNDNDTVQVADPRFYFDYQLYDGMSYFKFSAGGYRCATKLDNYEPAFEACHTLEPIIRFNELKLLVDERLEYPKFLQLDQNVRFRCIGNPIPITKWLSFIYKYAKIFLTPPEQVRDKYGM